MALGAPCLAPDTNFADVTRSASDVDENDRSLADQTASPDSILWIGAVQSSAKRYECACRDSRDGNERDPLRRDINTSKRENRGHQCAGSEWQEEERPSEGAFAEGKQPERTEPDPPPYIRVVHHPRVVRSSDSVAVCSLINMKSLALGASRTARQEEHHRTDEENGHCAEAEPHGVPRFRRSVPLRLGKSSEIRSRYSSSSWLGGICHA